MFRSASVVIPVKNVAPWIAEAIRSVDDIEGIETEIIVVDDQSTDGTREVVRGLGDSRVKLIDNEGTGPADGRNTGLAAAAGELLFQLDGDDRFIQGSRAHLIRKLAEAPWVVGVAGGCRFIDADGRQLTFGDLAHKERDLTADIRRGGFVSTAQFVFRTQEIRELGWARSFFRVSEDRDFLFRLVEHYEVSFLPIVVSEFRLRPGSLGRTNSRELEDWYLQRVHEFRRQRYETGQDDLMRGKPPEPPEFPCRAADPPGRAEVRMMLSEAWQLRQAGRIDDAARNLFRSLSRRRYLKHALIPSTRLGVCLLRDATFGSRSAR